MLAAVGWKHERYAFSCMHTFDSSTVKSNAERKMFPLVLALPVDRNPTAPSRFVVDFGVRVVPTVTDFQGQGSSMSSAGHTSQIRSSRGRGRDDVSVDTAHAQ
jgi:hypothetical protein